MAAAIQVIWLRNDLRLADQAAIHAAAASGPILPIYILDNAAAADWRHGGASRWWLHKSLERLRESFAAHGAKLILRRGDSVSILQDVMAETGAEALHATRHFEPWNRRQEKALAQSVNLQLHANGHLFEPGQVTTKSGGPFKVFSPFWRACQALGAPPKPMSAPDSMSKADLDLASDALADWALLPTAPNWATGFEDIWTPGEAGAAAKLEAFSPETVSAYKTQRDLPATDGTSQLSPHLHFGEITARQIWHHFAARMPMDDAEPYIRQLGWRDFSINLLNYAPHMAEDSWSPKFTHFPWREDVESLRRWQRGQTGYPIVDAGMRQLWQTGWMHNRVRMIVASFLTKHLLLHWRHGEDWFWDTLVDANLANNAAGWQWVAGSGADASPYFRIFNPITQSEKFDGDGAYIRRFVPELSDLPPKFIHAPWTAPQNILQMSKVTLGKDYPEPMVDHGAARQRALDAYQTLKAA